MVGELLTNQTGSPEPDPAFQQAKLLALQGLSFLFSFKRLAHDNDAHSTTPTNRSAVQTRYQVRPIGQADLHQLPSSAYVICSCCGFGVVRASDFALSAHSG
jgi:hypothetical protein